MGYKRAKKVMKKIMLLLFCSMSVLSFAQYTPTKDDLGKDCATHDGKLGTWKEVSVTETYSSTGSQTRSNSSSQNFNASAGAEYKSGKVRVSGDVGYGNGSSKTNSNSNSSTNTTSRTYQDIQCVEDKNANLPQYTPVRW